MLPVMILKVDLKKIAFSSFKQCNFLKELNLSQPEFQALKKLKSNLDIFISKSILLSLLIVQIIFTDLLMSVMNRNLRS